MPHKALIESFKRSIAPEKTRIYKLPSHILVFGGQTNLSLPRHVSCRNVFLLKASELRHHLSPHFKIPEEYPEWNEMEGYDNLVEFELHAGCLARAIVLITETPGAIAELGAFCMDAVLRERLLVVIEREYVNREDSFICLGPLRLIRKHSEEHSVCAVDSLKSASAFESEVEATLDTLDAKLKEEAQRPNFSPDRTRDQFLLIADLVDLFRALNKSEIEDLLRFMHVSVSQADVRKMLWQLKLFGLLKSDQVYGVTYYVAIKGQDHQFLDYEASADAAKPFARTGFKVQVNEALKKDQKRNKAYNGAKGV